MSKKLIPHRVTNIGVHKSVMNNYSGKPEFTSKNCITNIDVIAHVLDMKNKIVVKSFLLYDDLNEGCMYDLLISQDMEDHTTREYEVQKRERLNMKLSKIEIPNNDNDLLHVTYVFEGKACAERGIDKLKELETNLDKITKLTMKMISKDCEQQSLKDNFNKLKTEVYNVKAISEDYVIKSNDDNTFSISAKVEVNSSDGNKQTAMINGKVVDWKIKF